MTHTRKSHKTIRVLLASGLLLVLAACGPGTAPGDPPAGETPPPTVTAPGTPVGDPVTRTLGPAGGTLETPDGRVQLTFLPGALGADTALSLQPVTHALPNGVGLAYELRPPGVALAQPLQVRVRPSAEDQAGAGDELGLALQDDGGAWFALGGTQLVPAGLGAAGLGAAQVGGVNGQLRRLGRGSRLVRAIGVYAKLRLTPAGAAVRVGQGLTLNLSACDPRPPAVPPAPGEDDLAPIGCGAPPRNASRLSASAGQLSQTTPSTLRYAAPGAVPSPNPVVLTVRYDAARGQAAATVLGTVRVVEGFERYTGRITYRLTGVGGFRIEGVADVTYGRTEEAPDGTESRYALSGGTFTFTWNPSTEGVTCPDREFTLPAATGEGGGLLFVFREGADRPRGHGLSFSSQSQFAQFACTDSQGRPVTRAANAAIGIFSPRIDYPYTDEAVLEATNQPMTSAGPVSITASWRLQGE